MALRFSVTLKSIPVEIEEEGKVKTYTLRELKGPDRDAWLNVLSKRMKFDAKGTPQGISNYAGMFSGLVAKCLYDEKGQLVPEEVIQSWPAPVSMQLYLEAQKLSGLEANAGENAKNS